MAFGSKNSTPSFVLALPMVIGLNEQDLLYKEFKKCGIIYCMVQIADRSEVGHKSFEDAAFDDQCNTSEVDKRNPLYQMGGKLFARQKLTEFHRCVLDYSYRTTLWQTM